MLDYLGTGGGEEIVERDDSFIIATERPADYFGQVCKAILKHPVRTRGRGDDRSR